MTLFFGLSGLEGFWKCFVEIERVSSDGVMQAGLRGAPVCA